MLMEIMELVPDLLVGDGSREMYNQAILHFFTLQTPKVYNINEFINSFTHNMLSIISRKYYITQKYAKKILGE